MAADHRGCGGGRCDHPGGLRVAAARAGHVPELAELGVAAPPLRADRPTAVSIGRGSPPIAAALARWPLRARAALWRHAGRARIAPVAVWARRSTAVSRREEGRG